MISEKDLQQIMGKGINPSTIENQIDLFKKGVPFINLWAPANIENGGILKLNNEDIDFFNQRYASSISKREFVKFVPASGAATRMFKSLFSFNENYDGTENAYSGFLSDNSFNSPLKFFTELKTFPFYDDLKNALAKNNLIIDDCIQKKDFCTIIDFLLTEKGLNYASLPKGLIKFHKYDNYSRTAFEEHFVEAASYSRSFDNIAKVHFTISPEHIEKFESLLKQTISKYESLFGANFDISYSLQKAFTDTIAVDMDNNPFRNNDDSLLFRPGGHGALLENLNDLNGDIVFIKNIDNIVPDRLKEQTIIYKKALAGYLLEIQEKTHHYLRLLLQGDFSAELISEIIVYAKEKLKIPLGDMTNTENSLITDILVNKLNRPIRICGMVKNEGEPGGGPFWVRNSKNEISLQIVESSQIDFADPAQQNIFKNATHFNPVDLVCGVRDYNGKKFNLMEYTDPETCFISIKSKDGRDLKAMELPGLWNGAMANWITIFVEVPIITFNPVKTINDLLREEHQ